MSEINLTSAEQRILAFLRQNPGVNTVQLKHASLPQKWIDWLNYKWGGCNESCPYECDGVCQYPRSMTGVMEMRAYRAMKALIEKGLIVDRPPDIRPKGPRKHWWYAV